MLVKVCGLREPDNIRAVAAAGADMLGFIFYQKSPRHVSPVQAETVGRMFATEQSKAEKPLRVGVFVNGDDDAILSYTGILRLDCIQLHGNETPDALICLRERLSDVGESNVKLIKALSIASADDVKRATEYAGAADILLFDTKGKSVGGNGVAFDWGVLDAYTGNLPFMLSGGIGPEDADKVSRFSHPRMIGVDLNSRFETSPGVKDAALIARFINRYKKIEP